MQYLTACFSAEIFEGENTHVTSYIHHFGNSYQVNVTSMQVIHLVSSEGGVNNYVLMAGIVVTVLQPDIISFT